MVIRALSYQEHKKLVILKAKAFKSQGFEKIAAYCYYAEVTIQVKKRERIKVIWVVSADYYPVPTPQTGIFDNSSMKLFFQRTVQNV